MDKIKEKEFLRLLEWATDDDTGTSSEYLCRYMLGLKPNKWGKSAPSDKWDRGRCIRLLNLMPSWWNRLEELRPDWGEQIDLILEENLSK